MRCTPYIKGPGPGTDSSDRDGVRRQQSDRWGSVTWVLASLLVAMGVSYVCGTPSPLQAHRRMSAPVRAMRRKPPGTMKTHADTSPGLCHEGSPQWESLPSALCRDITCLWSEHTKRSIDLWLEVLKPLDHRVLSSRCPAPAGGQTDQGSVAAGQPADIAFVLIMQNNPTATSQCLLELFRTAREVNSAQFLIVDDGSTEDITAALETGRHLQHLFKTDFTYIRNAEILGHASSSNVGIAAATAEYIALVDSNVLVHKGWLYTLMTTIRSSNRIGMVGPLLENSNGTIAHAGGLLFSDGSFEGIQGRVLEHPLPSWLSRRTKVDFLDESLVVVNRDTALSLGGLNAGYQSGHWELLDLAMMMREAGLDVVMQPLATAHYQEGKTLSGDAKAHPPRLLPSPDDNSTFMARWGEVLGTKHCSPRVGKTAVQLRNRPSILYVEHSHPQPEGDAGSVRAAALLRILIEEGYSVTYAATATDFVYSQPLYKTHMRFLGVEVLQLNLNAGAEWPLTATIGNQSMCRFDYILAARQAVAAAALPIVKQSCPESPVIFDTVDVAFLREARIAMVEQQGGLNVSQPEAVDTGLEATMHWIETDTTAAGDAMRALQHNELSVAKQADAVIAVSEVDLQLLKRFCPQLNGHVISNIASNSAARAADPSCLDRHGMLFIGSFTHFPNGQAVSHFLRDVLPILQRALPARTLSGLQLHVVGSGKPPSALRAILAEQGSFIMVHVNLSNELLKMLLARVKILVAPLLTGGGVKGKVVMAMAHGLPVIGYDIALEGIQIASSKDAMLARNAADFAKKAAATYTDCSLWLQLSHSGRQVVARQFSETAALEGLRGLFGSLPRASNSTLSSCPNL